MRDRIVRFDAHVRTGGIRLRDDTVKEAVRRFGLTYQMWRTHYDKHLDNPAHAESMVLYEMQRLAFLRATITPDR